MLLYGCLGGGVLSPFKYFAQSNQKHFKYITQGQEKLNSEFSMFEDSHKNSANLTAKPNKS